MFGLKKMSQGECVRFKETVSRRGEYVRGLKRLYQGEYVRLKRVSHGEYVRFKNCLTENMFILKRQSLGEYVHCPV